MPISLNGNGQVTGVAAFDTPTLVVDETNNRVGIGTNTPGTALNISGPGGWSSFNYGKQLLISRSPSAPSNPCIAIEDASGSNLFSIANASGSIIFSHMPDINNSSTAPSEKMRIDTLGNVGIGTSTPTHRLHIRGSYANSAGGIIVENIESSGYAALWMNDSTVGIVRNGSSQNSYAGAGSLNIYTLGLHNIGFVTNNTERMRIDSSGNVGVGTVTTATDRLLVATSTFNHTTVRIDNSNSSQSATLILGVSARAASSAYNFFAAFSGTFTDREFSLDGDGIGKCDGSWQGGGADYAEYFEWLDGNPNNEDRRGIVVTLEGDKIKPAEEGDIIIGAISGNPSVIGDAAWNKWHEKYLRDDYGTYIFEDYDVLQWVDEEGKEKAVDADGPDASDAPEDAVVVIQQRRKLNPAYDPDVEYISRENRPEWDCVGLMGKLRIRRGQPVKDSWIKMKDISDTVEEWLVV